MSRGKIYEQLLEKSEEEIEMRVDPKFKSCWINDQVSQKQLQEVDSGSGEITLISSHSSWLSVMGWQSQWKVDDGIVGWEKQMQIYYRTKELCIFKWP